LSDTYYSPVVACTSCCLQKGTKQQATATGCLASHFERQFTAGSSAHKLNTSQSPTARAQDTQHNQGILCLVMGLPINQHE